MIRFTAPALYVSPRQILIEKKFSQLAPGEWNRTAAKPAAVPSIVIDINRRAVHRLRRRLAVEDAPLRPIQWIPCLTGRASQPVDHSRWTAQTTHVNSYNKSCL